MAVERKSEVTGQVRATAEDGQVVLVDVRTNYTRSPYNEGGASNWAPGERTFWLGRQKLGLYEDGTLRDTAGRTFTPESPLVP